MKHKFIVIVTTTDSKDVKDKLADILIKEKLAACVQVDESLSSVYWNDKYSTTKEYRIWIKTLSSLFDKVETCIRKHHNYEIPQIISLKIDEVSQDYKSWLLSTLN